MKSNLRILGSCISLVAGCATSSLSESEYVRSLSANATIDQSDPESLVVSVDCLVLDSELWQTCRIFLVTSTDAYAVGEFTTPVGEGGYATNIAVDDVPGVDPASAAIRIDYSVYRGQPSQETLLFSGTVTKNSDRGGE